MPPTMTMALRRQTEGQPCREEERVVARRAERNGQHPPDEEHEQCGQARDAHVSKLLPECCHDEIRVARLE